MKERGQLQSVESQRAPAVRALQGNELGTSRKPRLGRRRGICTLEVRASDRQHSDAQMISAGHGANSVQHTCCHVSVRPSDTAVKEFSSLPSGS